MASGLAGLTELGRSDIGPSERQSYGLLARMERDRKESLQPALNQENHTDESLGQVIQTISSASQTIKALVSANNDLRNELGKHRELVVSLQDQNNQAFGEIESLRDQQANMLREHEAHVAWLTAEKNEAAEKLEDSQRALFEAEAYLHEMTDSINRHLGSALRQLEEDATRSIQTRTG